MNNPKKIVLTKKEELVVAIAGKVEVLCCPTEEANKIFEEFAPEGDPTGLTLSTTYKTLVKKSLLKDTKYYLLTIIGGTTDLKNTTGTTEWCDHIIKFKDYANFSNYIDYIKLVVSKKNNPRITFEEG
jgi:hypothetical protein